jgi:glycosyltransferase involved in cell wall biosynthesis
VRILTIVRKLGPGGTERAAQNYTIGYHNRGLTTAVLTTHAGGPRETELRRHAIPLFIGSEDEQIRREAIERAIEWGPDIVHIHRPGLADPITTSIMRSLVKDSRTKVKILETNVFSWPDYSAGARFIDVHLHLSEWCLWKWRQWTRTIKPQPLGTIVPYAVDTSNYFPEDKEAKSAYRRELGIPDDAFVFGRVGQANEPKWSITALRAFYQVARSFEDTYLLVVGLPEKYKRYVDSFEPSVRGRVVHIPFVAGDEQLRKIYNAMDVFIHSSHKGESFGLVLAEAMLCGVPVITLSTPSRDNSQIEVVGQMKGGIVVADEITFREAMKELMQYKETLKSLSTGSRERIMKRYDSSVVLPQMLHTIEQVHGTNNLARLTALFEQSRNAKSVANRKYAHTVLKTVRGRTPLKEKLLMRLVHEPRVYRIWNRLRGT